MDNKLRYITALRAARTEHNKWLNTIKIIVSGFQEDQESVALNQSESPFGVWLNSEAILFSTLNSKASLVEIETLHNECYELYHQIYKTLLNTKSGFFSSILKTNRPSSSDLIVAQNYYEDLVKVSNALSNKMRVFENQVQANPAEKFLDIYVEQEPSFKRQETKHTEKKEEPRYYRGSLISDE